MTEPTLRQEDELFAQREAEACGDTVDSLGKALWEARSGHLSWEEIQAYANRADRAASACRSLCDAFSAELKKLKADGKIPLDADMYWA
jgi:hypothetical protein